MTPRSEREANFDALAVTLILKRGEVAETRKITLQPWAVAAPALLIAFLTISVNLVADAVARSLGPSTDRKRVAR